MWKFEKKKHEAANRPGGRQRLWRLEFPILSLNPRLRQHCVAPDVWPTLSRADLCRMCNAAMHGAGSTPCPASPTACGRIPPARASSSTPSTLPSAPTCPPRGRTSSTLPTTPDGARTRSSQPIGGWSRRWRAVIPIACWSSTATASPSAAGARRADPLPPRLPPHRRPQPAGPRRQEPRHAASILDSARALGIRDAQVVVAARRHQCRVGQKLWTLIVKQAQGRRSSPEFNERSAYVSHRLRSLRHSGSKRSPAPSQLVFSS